MCMYSLHARNGDMRRAKVGETLVLSEYRGHAAFFGSDGKLTCIKHGTTVHIENLQFILGVTCHTVKEWAGKTVTVKMFQGSHTRRQYAADSLILRDEGAEHPSLLLPLQYLRMGLTAYIPKKVRSDKGVPRPHRRKRNLVKVLGLDQPNTDVVNDDTALRSAFVTAQ